MQKFTVLVHGQPNAARIQRDRKIVDAIISAWTSGGEVTNSRQQAFRLLVQRYGRRALTKLGYDVNAELLGIS